ENQRAVGRVAGVVLHVGAEGDLFPVAAVGIDLVDVALDGLAEDAFAIFRPLGRAARFFGFELELLLAVGAEDEDADVAQVAAGDGEVLAVGAERGDAAALPAIRGEPLLLA